MCLFVVPGVAAGASALSAIGANAALVGAQLSLYSAAAQEVMAYRQEDQANELRVERARANNVAAATQMSANQQSLLAEEDSINAELERVTREVTAQTGTAVTAAAEAGVGGGSIDDLVSDFYLVEGQYQRNAAYSRASSGAAVFAENNALHLRARNENNAFRPNHASPSILRFAMNAGVGAFDSYSKFSPPKGG